MLKEGQALVRVKAFGINRADVMQRDGEYPVPPWAPNILGLEFSGIIEELGENSEPSFKIGDEVFALAYGGKMPFCYAYMRRPNHGEKLEENIR